MDNDDEPTPKINQSLPLPQDSGQAGQPLPDDATAAADLIRQKIEAAYNSAPDVAEEALDVAEIGPAGKRSRHQQFIYDLTNSGKTLPEMNAAWQEYYAGLTDEEKHQVWQEYEASRAQASSYSLAKPAVSPIQPGAPLAPQPVSTTDDSLVKKLTPGRTVGDMKRSIYKNAAGRTKLKPAHHFQSLLFGLGIGSITVLIFLFGFFNERFVAPFIQPSRNVSNTPIIGGPGAVSGNPQVIIPKINVEIPVVYGVNTISEDHIQKALENGVVHYADTAEPGQNGNVVVVGHSSNNIFNKGKYKFAFVLLRRMDKGDTFYLDKNGKRYTYEVYEKRVVKPNDVSVLGTTEKPATATLITCDPPGSSAARLVVFGQQISPDIATNSPAKSDTKVATQATVVPGNSPSLWSRIIKILST